MATIALYHSIGSFLQNYFNIPLTVTRSRMLNGGCIGDVHRLSLCPQANIVQADSVQVSATQTSTVPVDIVVKQNRGKQAKAMCLAEAEGLRCIADTKTIRVPKVLAIIEPQYEDRRECSIVLSYIDNSSDCSIGSPATNSAGNVTANFWVRFGQELASMHSATPAIEHGLLHTKNSAISNRFATDSCGTVSATIASGIANGSVANSINLAKGLEQNMFGFVLDNFIGSTPQINTYTTSWVEFYRTHRLWYQFRLAEHNKYFDSSLLKQAERLCNKLEQLIPEPMQPSLLHGDLWSGNYMRAGISIPVLIDPAVYYGHYEADIAMTELFGCFAKEFYLRYSEQFPLDKDYYSTRKKLYNLYHLLNHLNLFGTSYLGSVRSILNAFI